MKKILLQVLMLSTLLVTSCKNPFFSELSKVYTASFEADGGSEVEPQTVHEIEKPPMSTKKNCNLLGWYIDSKENLIQFPYTLEDNTKFTALWEQLYEVYFDTGCEINIENFIGKKIESEPFCDRDGYKIEGWFLDKNFNEKIEFPFILEKDITLYAKWKKIKGPGDKITVSYTTTKGITPVSLEYIYGEKLSSKKQPTISANGYSFDGWLYNGTIIDENTVLKDDLFLTASFSLINYTITYTLNGGEFETEDYVTIYNIESETITLTRPVRSGYTFAGWYLKEKFSDTFITQIQKGSFGNIILFAKWEEIPAKKVKITYSSTKGIVPAQKTINEGAKITEDELPELTEDGYLFDGWYIGSTKILTTYTVNSDITLTAKWSIVNYTISMNANGGTLQTGYATIYNIESNDITLFIPKKNGYQFEGWYLSEDFTGNAETKISKGSFGNKTFYAKWKTISYSITYNDNNGTMPQITKSSYTIEDADFSLPTPTRNGYTFEGWYTTNNYSGSKVSRISQGSTGDKIFYAKWTIINYTITYNVNGGTMPVSYTRSFTVETPTFTLVTPTKNGYKFEGWYLSEDFTGNAETKISKGSFGNKTFYAKWVIIPVYTITYNLNGGNLSGTYVTSFTETSPNIFLPTPSKTNYTFMGWYENPNFTGSDIIYIPTNTKENKIFYAKWESSLPQINTYYVTSYNLSSFDFTSEKKEFNIVVSGGFTENNFTTLTQKIKLSSAYVNIDLSNIQNLTTISKKLFYEFTNLKSMVLPSSLITIGEYAFRGCRNLEFITIPDSVTTIEEGTFGDCSKLKSIIIPDSVTTLGAWAFSGCESLESVTLSKNIMELVGTFHYCLSLTSIILPSKLTVIGNNVLYATNITEIIIPETVTSIGSEAFACTNITRITIPNSVRNIDGSYVLNCYSLQYISLPTNSQWYYKTQEGGEYKDYENLNFKNPEKMTGHYAYYQYQWYRKD